MCLVIRISPLPSTRRAKRRPLEPVDGTPHVVSVRNSAYEISPDGTCGCGLLTEDADWNEATWDMRPEMRDPLARTTEAVIRRLGHEAVFEALWSGEPFQVERVTSPERMITLIREGRVETQTRYHVMLGAGG